MMSEHAATYIVIAASIVFLVSWIIMSPLLYFFLRNKSPSWKRPMSRGPFAAISERSGTDTARDRAESRAGHNAQERFTPAAARDTSALSELRSA